MSRPHSASRALRPYTLQGLGPFHPPGPWALAPYRALALCTLQGLGPLHPPGLWALCTLQGLGPWHPVGPWALCTLQGLGPWHPVGPFQFAGAIDTLVVGLYIVYYLLCMSEYMACVTILARGMEKTKILEAKCVGLSCEQKTISHPLPCFHVGVS